MKRVFILILIVLFIFIFYLSSYLEGEMIKNQIFPELIDIAKAENWKMVSLQEVDAKNSGIEVFSFKDTKASIIYKDKVYSLEDPVVILSNDTQKIGFWVKKYDEVNSLNIIDSNGLNIEKIIDVYGGHNLCWSPDSKKLAFVGTLNEKENKYSLYVVDIDTKKTEFLIDNVDYITNQSWSPDNSELLYVKNSVIMSYSFSSKISRKIIVGNWPVCSPDGKWIAYLGEAGIEIISPNGSKKELLTRHESTLFSESMVGTIVTPIFWLPNSKFIIYGKCQRDHCEIGTPFVINIINKHIEQIPEQGWILSSWAKQQGK